MKRSSTIFRPLATAFSARKPFNPLTTAMQLFGRCNTADDTKKNEMISLLQNALVSAQCALGVTKPNQPSKAGVVNIKNIDITLARQRFNEVQSILQGMNSSLSPDELTATQCKTVADAHAATVGFLYKTSGLAKFEQIQYHLKQALRFDPKNEAALNYQLEFETDYSPPNKPQ